MSKKPRKKCYDITITLYDDEGSAVSEFMQLLNKESGLEQAISYETFAKQALFRTIEAAYNAVDRAVANGNQNTQQTVSDTTSDVSTSESSSVPVSASQQEKSSNTGDGT